MPLIVICGQPSSGKSTIAQRIARACKDKGHDTVVVDEESLHLIRNESYKDVPSEKNTRGLLRSVTDRSLTPNRIVIFDSLNNIKGYRYELWCVTRGAATKYLMVHVDTPTDTCRAWNSARKESESYRDEIFEDLASRFERPDSRNKWDSPLFTIQPLSGEEHVDEVVNAVVSCTVGENVEESMKLGSASGGIARNLSPAFSTRRTPLSSTNLLHELDKETQKIVDIVVEAQTAAGSGAPGTIRFGEGLPTLSLQKQIPLAELRRHKRTFLKVAKSTLSAKLNDAHSAQLMFIELLREASITSS